MSVDVTQEQEAATRGVCILATAGFKGSRLHAQLESSGRIGLRA